ncbi:MAG: cell wall hydrolase [Clostridia bacterium]|nr:cell wall hydrolase [Clostridia bacterium]
MKKRWILLIALFLMLAITPANASASIDINFDTPITLTVNNTLIKTDTDPFLYQGSTFVPIRFISEALGADSVEWNGAKNEAVIVYGEKIIRLPKGKKGGYINDRYVTIPSGVQLVNNRIYVPVRFVSEELDCQVNWIYETYTVDIRKKGVVVPHELVGKRSYTDDEIYWLSKIIHAESQGEPMTGKIAVGNVVLNRVESRDYPNTIYGVIFDKNHGVQFSPVLNGTIYHTPYGDSIIAAKRALEGESHAGESLFFLNPRISENFWIPKNRTYFTTIANHDFYL